VADIWSRAKRSEVMSRIRGVDTQPELALRRILTRSGLRYRVHPPTVPGKPDIAFPGSKLAVFVHGCFWHGCKDHYRAPKSNAHFWRDKVAQNRRRDLVKRADLARAGWTVLEFWEHEVEANPQLCAERIESTLRQLRTEA